MLTQIKSKNVSVYILKLENIKFWFTQKVFKTWALSKYNYPVMVNYFSRIGYNFYGQLSRKIMKNNY